MRAKSVRTASPYVTRRSPATSILGERPAITWTASPYAAGLSPITSILGERLDIPWGTVDDLLLTCPTRDQIALIRRDFNISFDSTVPASLLEDYRCTPGGGETGFMTNIYNAFRVMMYLNFDSPMPLINSRNLYTWLKGLGLQIRFIDLETSRASEERIQIRYQPVSEPSHRYFVDRREGVGIRDLIGLLLHEARHTVPGGGKHHECDHPTSGRHIDSSLAYGGAWGLQYWYHIWLAQHSGPYLTDSEKEDSAYIADELSTTVFCDSLR